jgi:hypothetical protein
MTTIRWTAGFFGLVLLAGCGHGTPDSSQSLTTATAKSATLVPPDNPNDTRAWHAFIKQAILEVTHTPELHPYAFVVPAGDSASATQRRMSEAMAIRSMLGRTAVPGNMIALAGPDSDKVATVVTTAFQKLPSHAAQGLTVLFVGSPASAATTKSIVESAGARLRVVAIPQPSEGSDHP